MKILSVLGFANPFVGAGWTRIGFFADKWSRKGHIIEVLGAFSYKAFSKRGVKRLSNINIFNIIFNMGLTHPLVFILNTLISFAVSTLALLSRKPNAAIVSVPTGDVGLGAIIACKLTRTKCIVDYRDRWEDYLISISKSRTTKNFYYAVKKLALRMYASCNLVVCVTPPCISYLKKLGMNKVKFIPNGADIKIFTPLKKSHELNSFNLIYVGGATAYYRIDLVINALKLLSNRNIRNFKLHIVGRIPQTARNGLSNSDVIDNVVFHGEISDFEKLAKIVARGHVGIIPLSLDYVQAKSALPVKFFEYCACGVPVIATVPDDSILAKLIKEYKVGISVPSMDEKKLAEAIYRIYKNKPFREAAGIKARRLIEEKFDRNKIAEEYLNLIGKVLGCRLI